MRSRPTLAQLLHLAEATRRAEGTTEHDARRSQLVTLLDGAGRWTRLAAALLVGNRGRIA